LVHYYSPYGYALVTDSSDSFYDGDWGTSEDISSMPQDLALLKTTFVNTAFPMVFAQSFGTPVMFTVSLPARFGRNLPQTSFRI